MIYIASPLRRLWLSGLLHLLFIAVIFQLNRLPSRMFVGQQILAFDLIEPTPAPPAPPAPAPRQPPPQPAPAMVEQPGRKGTLDEILERLEKTRREYDRRQRPGQDLSDLRERLKDMAPQTESYDLDTTRLTQLRPPAPRPAPTTGQTSLEVGAFPFRWYLNILQQRVYNAWKQPSGLMVIQDFLKTVVHLRINRDGSISDIAIRESSRHSEMDRSALEAATSLDRLPPLPDAFTRRSLDINIHFEVSR